MGPPGKFGVEFVGDVTKDILVIPRILMKLVALWPDTLGIRTILYPITMYAFMVLMGVAQLVYFVLNIKDVTQMAATLSTFSLTLQTVFKTAILLIHSGSMGQLIADVRKHFWSSNLMGVETEMSLKSNAKMVASAMLFVHTVAFIFMFSFLSIPAIMDKRELPFVAYYPFDWWKSPIYELLYFVQGYAYVMFAVNGVLAHDNLFHAIVTNCVGQFELLKLVMSKIGSPEIYGINEKLDQYYGDDGHLSGDTKLLRRCIKHHCKLIGMCNDLERIFTLSIAMQFAASLSAICLSSYLITVIGLDPSQLPHLFSYALGHLAQLFFFCMAGSELTYQASTLSTHLFNSEWYQGHVPNHVKKALPIVIQRSQKCQKITAIGMADLNYNAFVKLLQLSFSFHTLLSEMAERE